MRTTALLLVSLAFVACSSSSATDAGTDVVTPTDMNAPTDAAPDVAPDAAPDVAHDVAQDVARDVANDTRPPEPFCDVPGVYTYGLEGGLVPSRETVRIEPGRQFTYTRRPLGVDAGVRTCTTMLDFCGTSDGGTVDTLAVINAFNNADVMAAFNDQITTLYGRDTRPADGQVFVVTRGDGRHFEIGSDCAGATGCRAIPAGLARLRAVLTDLQTQQLARPECAGARP